jgi:hypothetical protein
MTIVERIQQLIDEGKADTTDKVSDQLQEQAIAVILEGLGTDAWRTYMSNFADPERPEQLARLMGEDDAGQDPYMQKALAYLVANATCGIFTRGRLIERLDDGFLDSGL